MQVIPQEVNEIVKRYRDEEFEAAKVFEAESQREIARRWHEFMSFPNTIRDSILPHANRNGDVIKVKIPGVREFWITLRAGMAIWGVPKDDEAAWQLPSVSLSYQDSGEFAANTLASFFSQLMEMPEFEPKKEPAPENEEPPSQQYHAKSFARVADMAAWLNEEYMNGYVVESIGYPDEGYAAVTRCGNPAQW